MDWLADHWLDLFGWFGSALLIISLLQARVLRFRLLNLVASVALVAYNALIEVWPMVGMNLAIVVINLWFIVRMLRERHDEQVFQALEVGADDPFLRHFLTHHGADVARFQPDFRPASLTGDDLAFQVLRGDEAVGVVVIRREGDVARVLLDYVTPRYRDFSPGEFVWNGVAGLRARGFRKIVTPPNMVDSYYHRLQHGFRREGSSYVLDL